MKSGLVNEFTSQTNAIPLTATLPPSITANKAALTKAKALRTSCRSRKVRFAVIDDSNGVPIDATASSTENYGTVALIEQALMMFRLNSTKLPQGGCILATHQGGGVKPLDSQTKDAASATLALNQIFRGDAACFSNLSGSLPAASLGATATLQGGAAHRNWYAIIDLTVNGPLKYRNLSTVYIEYMANANASGNQGVCGTGVPLLDGSGVTTVSTSGVDVGTAVVDLIDGTGLTLNNPLAGADMTAIDAAAVVNAQTTTINGVNTNPATIMGNVHATPLTLVANKINIIRIKPQANKVFVVPRIFWEDANSSGLVVYNCTSSGNSDTLCRYHSYDVNGVIQYPAGNPVLDPYYNQIMAWSMYLGLISTPPNSPSHNTFGLDGIFDFNFANSINAGDSPAQMAAAFQDKCTLAAASASSPLVIKGIWCPWADITNLDGYITGTGTGSHGGYKYADYKAALQAVVAANPGTAVLLDCQQEWDNILPSVRQSIYQDSGVYSPGQLDPLHDNIFARNWVFANLVRQFFVRCADLG